MSEKLPDLIHTKYDAARDGREAPYTFNAPNTFNLNPGDNYLTPDQAEMVAACLSRLVENQTIEFDREIKVKEYPEPTPEAPVVTVDNTNVLGAIEALTIKIEALAKAVALITPTAKTGVK